MSSRTRLGWDPFFEQQSAAGETVARVVQVERDAWRVDGDVSGWTELAGRMRHLAESAGDLPAVGDWVVVDRVMIVRRLERRSAISRAAAGRASVEQVIAANIDTVFVVTSANEDLSERRIERYLPMIWDGGATPVVAVNKADLAEDADAIVQSLRTRLPFVDVVRLSALAGDVDALAPYLQPARTVALVGSSGVGKSTIVNRLLGSDVQKVAAIRESDGTGRHTTTSRELIALPGGALLIDTPGMRELQPWVGSDAIDQSFDDIAALAAQCRFADCGHDSEPDCAVKAALDAGTLDDDRLNNYRHLLREAAWEERKHDKSAAAAHKKRWKGTAQALKALYKERER